MELDTDLQTIGTDAMAQSVTAPAKQRKFGEDTMMIEL